MNDGVYGVYTTSLDGVHIDRYIDMVYDHQVVYTIDLGTTFTPIADLDKILSEHRWHLLGGYAWYKTSRKTNISTSKSFIGEVIPDGIRG